MNCCERFTKEYERDVFGWYRQDKEWRVIDQYGSICLDDIKFCPFCGKKLESPE